MNSVINAEGVFHLVLPEETKKSMQKILNGVYEKDVKRISHGLNIYCFNPVKAPLASRGNLYDLHTKDAEGVISITDGRVLHYYPVKLSWSCPSDPNFFKNHNVPSWRVILPLEVAKVVAAGNEAHSYFIRCDDRRSYLLNEREQPICHWETDINWSVYDWSSLFQDLWPLALSVKCLAAHKAVLELPYQIEIKSLKKTLSLFSGEFFSVFWNNKTRTIILAGNSHASAIAPIFKHD
jgi:hypothetical protein